MAMKSERELIACHGVQNRYSKTLKKKYKMKMQGLNQLCAAIVHIMKYSQVLASKT